MTHQKPLLRLLVCQKNKVRGNGPKAVKVCACARKSISKWRSIKLNVESEVDGISCENLLEMYRTSLKKPEGGWKCRQGRVDPLLCRISNVGGL